MGKKILLIQNFEIEDPINLINFCKEKGVELEIKKPFLLNEEKLPLTMVNYSGLVVLGISSSIYESEKPAYFEYEELLIDECIKSNVPVLGVCHGAILLAKIIGGLLSRAPEVEIGWHDIYVSNKGIKDPLFEGMEQIFPIFCWNVIFYSMPERVKYLAKTVKTSGQIYKFGERAYGLLFHTEASPKIIDRWLKAYQFDYSEHTDKIDPYKILTDTNKFYNDYKNTVQKIYENFFKLGQITS